MYVLERQRVNSWNWEASWNHLPRGVAEGRGQAVVNVGAVNKAGPQAFQEEKEKTYACRSAACIFLGKSLTMTPTDRGHLFPPGHKELIRGPPPWKRNPRLSGFRSMTDGEEPSILGKQNEIF
eukprot:1146211-Pelagomonas_calceolata.AAC.2